MALKLYKLSQNANNWFDTYDSCIVAAESAEEAVQINPSGKWEEKYSGWCSSVEQVECEYIGEAAEHITKGVVLSSFNAG
jgi:hypothetical protein